MKKLLIFLALITVVEASNRTYSLGFSINTTHITHFDENRKDYKFYEDNNVLTIESEKNKELLGIVAFKNSFGNDTIGVYGGKKFDKNNKSWYGVYRLGLIKGYNYIDHLPSLTDETVIYDFRNHTVFYKDYSLLAEVGLGYQFNKSLALESNLIANAVVTSVKYTF